jgi:hypothetical protein
MMLTTLKGKSRWSIFCGALMLVAFGFIMFGSLAFIKSKGGLGDALFFLFWGFGFFGILIFHLENAFAKVPLTTVGLGWSACASSWGYIVNRCQGNEICAHDSSGSAILIALCLISLGALLIYDEKKGKIPIMWVLAIKLLTRLIIFFWVLLLLVIIWVQVLKKPLTYTDRITQPIEQQSRN